MEEQKQRNFLIPIFIGGAVVMTSVVVGTVFLVSSNNSGSNNNQSATTYKDGTYTASGSFMTPEGNESVGVTLTLKNGNISNVQITNNSYGESAMYVGNFANGISKRVVGKSLNSTLDVSRVNGSSLTGEGFLKAVNNIKTQAKS